VQNAREVVIQPGKARFKLTPEVAVGLMAALCSEGVEPMNESAARMRSAMTQEGPERQSYIDKRRKRASAQGAATPKATKPKPPVAVAAAKPSGGKGKGK